MLKMENDEIRHKKSRIEMEDLLENIQKGGGMM
jgi:hypothetical protein